MSDADLWGAWRLWLGGAVVIIAVAAALLVTIIVTARQIVAQAVRARNAAEAIRVNTLPIWQLQTSNEVAAELVAAVRSIEQNGGALADALTRKR